MRPVFIATSSPGKLRDFAAVAGEVEVQSLPGLDSLPAAVEDGATFEENACKKAEHYSRLAPGKLVLADDSGLEVDALNGAPGVYSSRFAGENATYDDNNLKLLTLLAGVPPEKRTARFRCVLALALGPADVRVVEGKIEGVITDQPRGTNGFGYDPIFYIPNLKKTLAALSTAEKNQISHRGQALKKLSELLAQLVGASTP